MEREIKLLDENGQAEPTFDTPVSDSIAIGIIDMSRETSPDGLSGDRVPLEGKHNFGQGIQA
jgi:hypothetical protein